jgi:hypothetical protein
VSVCSIFNNLHVPASLCAGINVITVGALAQYFIVNGAVTLASANYMSKAIQSYTTNPCEVTATATTTDFSAAVETSAVVYTSTFEVDYVETITVSIPDPTTSSTLTTGISSVSSSAITLNTTSTLSATTSTSPAANVSSALSVFPVLNTTSSSSATTSTFLPTNASTTLTFVPILNTTISSTQSTHYTSLNATMSTVIPIPVNASSTAASTATSSAPSSSKTTVISTLLANQTSTLALASSTIAVPVLNTAISVVHSTFPSSSPIFQNTTRLSSAQLSPITSNAPVVIAVPTSIASPSTRDIFVITPRPSSKGPSTITRYITDVYTVTACPSEIKNCPASQKTTFLSTKTIVEYSTVQTATPSLDAQMSSVTALGSGNVAHDEISKVKYTTSTLYSTSIQTVTTCPSSVRNCPASKKTVYYTEVVKAYTTVCPVAAVPTEVVLLATAVKVPLPEVSSISTDSTTSSGEYALHTQSSVEDAPAVLSSSLAPSLKTSLNSNTASALTVSATMTYTAGGKILTSTRGISVVPVISSSSASEKAGSVATASPDAASSSTLQPLSSSVSPVRSVASSIGSSFRLVTTAGVVPNGSATPVPSAISVENNTSTSASSNSPTLASYTGSASAPEPHVISVVLDAVCVLFGFAFTI